MYDNFLKKEEYLTGVLNTKFLSTKNSDFRTKVWAWNESKVYWEKTDEKLYDKEQLTLKTLEKYSKDINLENNLIKLSKVEFEELMV